MINVGIVVGDITKNAGTERAVVNLANMLCRSEKYKVHVISMYSEANAEPCYKLLDGIGVFHLNLNEAKRIGAYLQFICSVKKIIEAESLQVILGTTHATNCLLYFAKRKAKIIACEHLSYEACPQYSQVIRRVIYPKVDAVVLLTKGDALNYRFVAPSKVYIIPNSLSFTSEVPAELNKKRIIAIGRLTVQKWFQKLIEAAVEIKKKLPDWRIDIFGEGEEKAELISLIKENKLDKYVYINAPVKNIQEQYLDADLLVVTSRWEGFPMSILEAEACGLPVVSFDCNYGPSDLICDGVNGHLVNMGDAKNLAQRIIEIARDDKKRKNMGKASFENAQKYREEEVFNLWNALFTNIIK